MEMIETVKKDAPDVSNSEGKQDAKSDTQRGERMTSFSDGLRRVFSKYAETASMNGMNVINAASSLTAKIVWGLLLAVAFGLMTFHLHMLINKYYLYKTRTNVELGVGELQFPAVTICNVNIMRLSQQKLASQKIRDLIVDASADMIWKIRLAEKALDKIKSSDNGGAGISTLKDEFDGNRKAITNPTYMSANNESSIAEFKEKLNGMNATELSEFIENHWYKPSDFTTELSNFNRSMRAVLGHQKETLLLACDFASKSCDFRNFTQFYSEHFGNCYTIQSDQFVSRSAGPDGGLWLILFLETNEYIPGISTGKGAQVVIHEQDTVPLPYEAGIAVNSGDTTMIALQQVTVERLGLPYGKCNDDTEYKEKYNVKFTRNFCQKLCHENKLRDICKCYTSTNIQVNDILQVPAHLPPCTNSTVLTCPEMETLFDNQDETLCDCYSPCREKEYKKSISSRNLLDQRTIDTMIDYLCNVYKYPGCSSLNRQNTNDFLELNIYFEDLNYQKISEEPEYEVIQLLSDVGGTIGLWIGLSLLSLCEIAHLIIDIGVFLVGRLRVQKK